MSVSRLDSGIRFEPVSAPLALGQKAPSYTAALVSLIETLEQMHDAGTKINSAQSAYLLRIQSHLSEHQKKILEQEQGIDAQSETSAAWQLLATIGAYILAAVHAVTGSYLIDQGSPVVGGIMIAAALLSISNLAASKCGFWEWLGKQLAGENHELAMQLSTLFPAVFALASAGLGFVGTGEIMGMVGEIDFARQILLIAQTALTFTEGVAAIGRGYSEYGVLTSQAELQRFQQEVAQDEHAMERLMQEMEQVVKTMDTCTSSTKRIIQTSINSSQTHLKI